jgi:hypothetical protein
MRYSNLDPKARYKIRVVYAGDSPKRKIRLMADEVTKSHPFIMLKVPVPPGRISKFTFGGGFKRAELSFSRPRMGLGGNGRGCQISKFG